MLRGEYVILRIPEEDDSDILKAWQSDKEVTCLLPFPNSLSLKNLDHYITAGDMDRPNFVFIIQNEDDIPIGICSLDHIDWVNGTSSIDITIYAKNCWGRGYGYDAVKALTYFGMDELNLYTIYACIPEDNERAIKCFQKAGYESEGRLIKRLYMNGSRKDLISLSVSKDKRQDIL